MLSEIMDRFKQIAGIKSAAEVAKILNTTTVNVYTWNSRNKIPYEYFAAYCKKTNVSLDWLLEGKGSKYRTLIDLDSADEAQKQEPSNEDTLCIPYYEDIRLSAGYGAINSDYTQDEMIYLPKGIFSSSKNIEAVKIIGDSMTPTIKNGSIVYVDRSEIDKIKNNAIYAMRINDDVFVKRLFVIPDGIRVRSDNKEYPEFTCKKDEIIIIGEIKGVTQKL